MKQVRFLSSILIILLLASCGEGGCGCSEEPIRDTKFTLTYKLIDGSWDTTSIVGPKATKFWVRGHEGTYDLVYAFTKERADNRVPDNVYKSAVIDFKMLSEETVLDTAAKRVELENDTTP